MSGHDLGADPTKSGVAKIIDWSVRNQILVLFHVISFIL